jgi:hypothetical protein
MAGKQRPSRCAARAVASSGDRLGDDPGLLDEDGCGGTGGHLAVAGQGRPDIGLRDLGL